MAGATLSSKQGKKKKPKNLLFGHVHKSGCEAKDKEVKGYQKQVKVWL